MSQIFHKILRKPFNGGTIRSFLNHQNPTPPLITHLVHQLQPNTQNPPPESSSDDKSTHFNRSHIYPSFSFGYFLNPISSTGFPDSKDLELDGSGSGNGMMWADSVKKKRKKKMNKHKLKKLKKRLRHCS
ncbi:hypothetical protein L1987_41613 [Smallanthus sonchifolius]|uniref:Uncharacterized protein n=1 Tax=Smallanthus sonchifolius TaxID=185202 RepID=A0ACB9GWC3_9ASTR|nr:hypothetical protein L1987_41613 [Smallanthus sonchifolius]